MQEIKDSNQDVISLVKRVADHLMQHERMLISAESCTGGMIGASCTQQAGSSAWFFGGLISYDNLAKKRMLQVSRHNLDTFGAVSQEVVEQMCAGALGYGVDVSVAVSGVAGPGGGSDEKPVGTVFIGWQSKESLAKGEKAIVRRYQFDGDRDAVRNLTLLNALQGVLTL